MGDEVETQTENPPADAIADLREQIRRSNENLYSILADQSAATAAVAARNSEAFAASETALSGIVLTTSASVELLRTVATRLDAISRGRPAEAPLPAPNPDDPDPRAGMRLVLDDDKPFPPTDSWGNEPPATVETPSCA